MFWHIGPVWGKSMSLSPTPQEDCERSEPRCVALSTAYGTSIDLFAHGIRNERTWLRRGSSETLPRSV